MRFRSDLEGLRGIAIALVVLFHFDLLGVRGGFVGVDAFYVLSGFLITALLLRELSETGGVDLAAFYARRARRILPAAIAALALTLVAGVFIVAPLDQPAVASDATACGLFVCNIVFALRATDYFASQAPSPFLHFWSLGVEEQFYLLWPLFLLLAFRLRHPRLLAWSLCATSFAAALALTDLATPWAFFSLPGRAWQLGAGALVALYAPTLERVPPVARAACAWVGAALLATAAVAFDHGVAYPGVAALVPTVAVILLIAARGAGASRILSFAPLRTLGRVSYSLYLFHWPVLVYATMLGVTLGVPLRWALVAFAIAVAGLSHTFVERPFLDGRVGTRARRAAFGLAMSATAAVVLLAQVVNVSAASAVPETATLDQAEMRLPSFATAIPAAATRPSVAVTETTPASIATPTAPRELRPRIADARADGDGLGARGCGLSLAGDHPPVCELGDPRGAITVVLIGDSHAAQWFPAVDTIATARGWRVIPFTKDSCIFLDMRIVSIHLEREYTECARWRTNVVAAVQGLHPDLAIVSSSRWVHPVDGRDADPARQAAAMARLVSSLDTRVALIADTPLMSQDVPACLSRRDRDARSCGTSREYALTLHLARDGRAAEMLGATLVDPTAWLCDDERCPAVIDRTIVYRDDHHLTATMARRLAPVLEPALARRASLTSRDDVGETVVRDVAKLQRRHWLPVMRLVARRGAVRPLPVDHVDVALSVRDFLPTFDVRGKRAEVFDLRGGAIEELARDRGDVTPAML